MTIRLATYGDEVKLFDAIIFGHSDNGLWPISYDKVTKLIHAAVKSEKTHESPTIGILESQDGKIEALTCFRLESYWYTDEWHIAELFNWVHPDHRKSQHVDELIRFQKEFTDNMSAAIGKKIALLTGVMSVKRLEAKINLFSRKYPQIGAIYAYNLDLPSDVFNQRRLEAI